jgi:hypothetical protein
VNIGLGTVLEESDNSEETNHLLENVSSHRIKQEQDGVNGMNSFVGQMCVEG